MVRFAWKADIGKKAKIMVRSLSRTGRNAYHILCQRKVKFPTELDALDLVTDELKKKLLPVSRRLLEFQTERVERRKIRRRTKVAVASSNSTASANNDVEMADANAATASTPAPENKASGELEDEHVYRTKELAELDTLTHPD